MNLVATAIAVVAADRPFGGPTSLASALTLFTLVAFYIVDRVAVTRASGGSSAGGASRDGSYAWIVGWQFAGLVALLIAPRVLPALDLPAWVWVPGLVCAWAGISLRVWAIRTLGHDFRRLVTVTPGQLVVSTGPYRYVRHPSYTGVLLTYAGLGLAQANIASIVAAVGLPLVGYARRITIEERALIEGLGQSYEEYAAGRSRLVPHLW